MLTRATRRCAGSLACEGFHHVLREVSYTAVMVWIILILAALWLFWPRYVKWKQQQKLRQFEQEQRRKWEQHRRE